MRRTGSGGGGEIVEVQGGHIVRSIGRKDRHSKVCTAKGPRDRRVRLSAHTAIQFYDVQDRLGYDRPSKAVDWLINKAKAAIDELAELPAWNPNTVNSTTTTQQETPNQQNVVLDFPTQNLQHTRVGETLNQSFLPPSLDSDSIADTIKSFFPTAAEPTVKTTSTPSIQFHNYPPDLISRTSSQNQDLRLSLQSFHSLHRQQNEHALFSSGFDLTTGGWSDHNSLNPAETEAEIGRFSRLSSSWNAENGGVHGGGGIRTSGYVFNSSSPNLPTAALPPFFSENQFFSQRGPLQSSNTPSIRAWIDPSITDHQHNHHHQHQIQPSSYSALGFASGGFSGFHIPTRIQGEEEHDGISDKPSSASSDSHH